MGTTSTPNAALRPSIAPSSSLTALGVREPRGLDLEDDAALRRAGLRVEVDDDVALLAAVASPTVADRLGAVAAPVRDRGQRLGDLLLVGAALRGAALGLLGDGLELLAARPSARRPRPASRSCVSFITRRPSACWSEACLIARTDAAWNWASGLLSSVAVNCLASASRCPRSSSFTSALTLVLDGARSTRRRSASRAASGRRPPRRRTQRRCAASARSRRRPRAR